MNTRDKEAALARWLTGFAGGRLKAVEVAHLERAIAGMRGRHVVQVGGMVGRVDAPQFERHTMVCLRVAPGADAVALPTSLPFVSDSIDTLVLPHAFDFGASPRELLREAYRVVRPEGHLVLSGLAPISILGLMRAVWPRRSSEPWSGHWYTALRVLGWLEEAGFDRSVAPRAVRQPGPAPLVPFRQPARGLQPLARRMAGVHILIAQKHERRLLPLPQRWRPREVQVIGFADAASARSSVQRREDH